mmetsp:Transcript_23057/g.58514  ORF Transcript_23057/g.58514 Transcript_23057/m.58514 type:complete len:254 (-) Transcript_23057:95-856(-)
MKPAPVTTSEEKTHGISRTLPDFSENSLGALPDSKFSRTVPDAPSDSRTLPDSDSESRTVPDSAWTARTVPEQRVSLGEEEVHLYLKSGVVLCELANRISPGSVKGPISRLDAPFPQRENIARFLAAASALVQHCRRCVSLGVLGHELFNTADLFGAGDLRQVLVCVGALGRAAHEVESYSGPSFGKRARARLGAHKESAHVVAGVGEGLWGKASGRFRPSSGPADSSLEASGRTTLRAASATGFTGPGPPAS